MNPAEWLARAACRNPNAPALLTGVKIQADYREFARRVAAIAAGLSEDNIAPGDRVALYSANSTAYLEALYAIWHAGAVAVPINAKLHEKEVAWILEDSGAKLLFGEQNGIDRLTRTGCSISAVELGSRAFDNLRAARAGQEPAAIDPDEMIWLFYTSGTTGRPKGVMLSSANFQAMAMAYFADVDTVEAGDAALYAAPLSHGAGIYTFMHVMVGARHVVPASGRFEAGEILDLAATLDRVSMFAAPTMVKRLVDHAKSVEWHGEGFKTIVYGGGPMYLADIVDAVEVMGSRFVQIYGQGECPMAITALDRSIVTDRSHPRWRERLTSVGMPQCCVRVRIADERGQELPRGQVGEITVQGQPVMRGYWQNEQASRDALRDGWLWTGDRGSMDEDGFIILMDRSKDVIISGGTNIYPREVEEVLLQCEGVSEVSVVGRQHDEWGEEVVAFVVMKEGEVFDAELLDAHCLANIARFKRPKAYIELMALPKNNYGKILKTDLRKILAAEAP